MILISLGDMKSGETGKGKSMNKNASILSSKNCNSHYLPTVDKESNLVATMQFRNPVMGEFIKIKTFRIEIAILMSDHIR